MGPAGEQSESRLRVLPAQDRLAPPLPLLPSRRRQRAHGGTFTSSSTCPGGRGPSALWGRVTLPMLSLRTCLLRFENTKQNRERKSKPSPLFLFHLFFGCRPPVPPQEEQHPLKQPSPPANPATEKLGSGGVGNWLCPFCKGMKPQREPQDIGIFQQNRKHCLTHCVSPCLTPAP